MNGRIEYFPNITGSELHREGTRATHMCHTGFVLNGTVNRTCQNDSFFDGAEPTCDSKSVVIIDVH